MEFKVSVIMPVYNVEKYIEASVGSVIKQNFDNYEIILVNDGTQDNSIDIAESILKDSAIPYNIIHKENGGLPSARNKGLSVARGEYVCFIDTDDIISTNHLSDLYECCKRNNLMAAYAPFELTYEKNRYGTVVVANKMKIIDREQLLKGFLIRQYKIHCCALLLNRKYLMKNEYIFNEQLKYGEDIDFMWRLFPSLTAMGCTENYSYKYLQRSNSLMTNQNIDRVIVLLDEFKKTVDMLMRKYPQDKVIFKYLYGKASLAFYRTFAESSSYELFYELLKRTNYRGNIKIVVCIGEIKISLLAITLLLSPKIFWSIVKKKRITVG